MGKVINANVKRPFRQGSKHEATEANAEVSDGIAPAPARLAGYGSSSSAGALVTGPALDPAERPKDTLLFRPLVVPAGKVMSHNNL